MDTHNSPAEALTAQERDRLNRYEARLKEMYAAEMAGVPEEHRGVVQTLSRDGDALQRLDALHGAKGIIRMAQTPAPASPATEAQPEARKPLTVKELKNFDWNSAIADRLKK